MEHLDHPSAPPTPRIKDGKWRVFLFARLHIWFGGGGRGVSVPCYFVPEIVAPVVTGSCPGRMGSIKTIVKSGSYPPSPPILPQSGYELHRDLCAEDFPGRMPFSTKETIGKKPSMRIKLWFYMCNSRINWLRRLDGHFYAGISKVGHFFLNNWKAIWESLS